MYNYKYVYYTKKYKIMITTAAIQPFRLLPRLSQIKGIKRTSMFDLCTVYLKREISCNNALHCDDSIRLLEQNG